MEKIKGILKNLLVFYKKCWMPLTIIFFIMNLMTVSWFIEDKGLNGGFYLFDYMTAHMESIINISHCNYTGCGADIHDIS